MKIGEMDVVYCVKNKPENEELRYSLRSLKNLPHNRVYLFGGCPWWVNLETVHHVQVIQNKGNKWLNTSSLLKEIAYNKEITDDFIWFNDDFFVLKPLEELPYYHDRTLVSRVMDFAKISWNATNNGYCSRLKGATRALKFDNRNILNYELHVPIVFNKYKLRELFSKYPGIGAKRSLYGNNFVENPIQRADVKIYNTRDIPGENWDLVSTSDISFMLGEVGKYIRKEFNKKGKYEQ